MTCISYFEMMKKKAAALKFAALHHSHSNDVEYKYMIKVIENSNLLDVESGIICHQVNCIGVMGGGVALQIRNRWPAVYEKYVAYCEAWQKPEAILGDVQDVVIDSELVVANCFGQIYPGIGCMTSYDAWNSILFRLANDANYFGLPLHFPWMIGCGLAGGDWNIMHAKLKDFFNDKSIAVHIHRLSA